MFFRVRTRLTDRPGALARLAERCGEAGVNILGLQLFPSLGTVTDELVVKAPDDWTATAVADLVSGAGGDEVSVEPCTTHDLVDQPTRWLAAVRDVIEDPARLPTVLGQLVGGDGSKWTATEHVRVAMLADIADAVRRPDASAKDSREMVVYDITETGVDARIGGHVVGAATLSATTVPDLTVEVAPAWRRLGIGTALLSQAAGVARGRGATELVLVAPAADEAVVPMLSSSGLRGLIRLSGGVLSARVSLMAVRPIDKVVATGR